jgi:hypothetical protein
MNRLKPKLCAGLAAAMLLSGPAAAQTSSPMDFDRAAPSPAAVLHELAARAAAMPDVPASEVPAAAPVAVPPLPKGTNAKYFKPFREAFLNASNRLRAPKCAAFYGEGGAAKFEGSEYRFLDMGKPHLNDKGVVTVVGAATYAEGKPPASVMVNAQGPFLTQSMYVIGKSGFQTVDMGTNLRGADFGALLLLHELGHVVGKFGPDAHDSDLNRSYTESVLKNCFR